MYDGMYIVGESVDGVNYTYSRGTDLLGYTSSLGETVYYRTNVHGDVKELVNVFGESLERYDYNAYGAEDEDYNPFRRMFGKKSVHNPFRYTGEYTDSETGLVYLRNRMYDPETGRFISEDTHWNVENCIYGDSETGNRPTTPDIGAIIQSSNLSAYCMGNPIMYVDKDGNVAVVASTALLALGKAIVVTGIGCAVISIAKLTKKQIDELAQCVSYTGNVSPSSGIDWGKDENGKHHVLNGSRDSANAHGPIWKKFGIDPNNNGGWGKLLPILKEVVDKGNEYMTTESKDGNLIYYQKTYLDEGVKVIVRLIVGKNGEVRLSDAWGELLK